ncbi:GTPase IMAP family member 9-like [Paramormyrops kingsleyae]|uniref:GTPase IMAP family member 7-like n=1 Tax=Paramormyrops kingsleyae TaxID=1676925 RepID=A0A3B3QVV2_9TELE|nr:GTPase IMAP family member 7-like [Paramormyrops kingsleyae]
MTAPAVVRIVLLGKNGSGKSSAGNVILGEEKFEVSCGPDVVSQDCQTEEGNLNGRRISVTEIPGIFHTERPEEDLKYSIIPCLTECVPGPHVIILVLRVGKYTKEEKQSVKMILEWFGKEALKHTVVLFTHGDDLGRNQTIKEFVERNKDLKELVDKCGGRVHVIDCKQWKENDDKNVQPVHHLEQLKKMMIEKGKAGELQTVQEVEELKNWLLGQRSSASDQEPGQGSGRPTSSGGNLHGSMYRSNSFQIKQLLTTIDTMVRDNGDSYYRNETLQVIAEAIKSEVNKIKEELDERGEKAEESEIRRRARERVRTKTQRSLGGANVGALLEALLGLATRSKPFIFISGFLGVVVAGLYKYLTYQN